jgi:acyl carrier protein
LVSTQTEVRAKLQEIMADTFDLDDLTIADNMTASDIEEWDSLSHIRLVVAIERYFSIRFANSEIEGLTNIGDLVNAITQKAA